MDRIKSVVIWGIPSFGWMRLPLVSKMKSEFKTKVHFICSSAQGVEYWKKQDKEGIVDSFITTNDFFFEYDNCSGSFEEICAQARAYEDKYNTFVVDVLQTDRHLGRGFSAAGPGHPKSDLSNKATYIKSVNLFNKAIKFWEDYFDKTNPDLVIGVVGSIIGKTCAVVARHRNITIRDLASSKFKSYFYWTADEYFSFPELEKNYNALTNYQDLAKEDELSGLSRLPWADQIYQEYIKSGSRIVLLKQILENIKTYLYKKRKKIITMGNYKLSENIKFLFKWNKKIRDSYKLKTTDTKELPKIDYVFYPLHTEPETAMGLLSPEFNEQMAVVELVAKNLPAGIWLVVKEHLGAVSRRPSDFHTTLLEIPNLKMVAPYEYAVTVAKDARCVLTISSTVGVEAAILGIPVIAFGIHNNFNFLPHVYLIESWKQLRPLLNKICSEDTQEAKDRRKADGLKYLAALKISSIDLSFSNYGSLNRAPATEKELEVLYTSLIKSLDLKPIN